MLETDYKFGEVHVLANQVESGADRVHVKSIFSTSNGGVALVAFKAGQALDTHVTPAEVMVTVLEGEVEFTILDAVHHLKAGEFLLLGAEVPHSVKAPVDAKLMLAKIKA
ncbi:MAG: cupin domain-containing protein [Muribaculaceae bacterium]|nr:cupin domain-containing protein [Muribaculaceae bacterium]